MATFPRLRPHILATAAISSAAMLSVAGGGAAFAQDRCEGTLCDLYYDHLAKPAPAQPPARTVAPSAQTRPAQASDGLLGRLFSGGTQQQADGGAAPPAKKPLVAVQGGGLVGLMQGRSPGRCSGTLCDLYYGGPPKEAPEAAEPPSTAPASRAEAENEEPVVTARGTEPRESVRSCTVNPRDPWACYRR